MGWLDRTLLLLRVVGFCSFSSFLKNVLVKLRNKTKTGLIQDVTAMQELDDELYIEVVTAMINETLRVFLRVAAQNSPHMANCTDATRLQNLRAEFGLRHVIGKIWGRMDCCADSLLQLLSVHGIIAGPMPGPIRNEAVFF